MEKKFDLRNLTVQELEKLVESLGEKRYRAKQIFNWIRRGIEGIDEIKNIPQKLKNDLKNVSYIKNMEILKLLISKIDGTRKYLLALNDGNVIESVLMKYKYGNTICISTQVGCKMGCSFCASAIGGVVRNLTAGEMIGQIYTISNDIKDRISHVVLMGSGEPLDNYDEVLEFLKLVNDEQGLNISMRNITISTCGIVPKIIELGKEKLQLTLAISLHAPNNELRNKIMPINKVYGIEQLLWACKEYIKNTNRRITFEYALINGLNDSKDCAVELSKLLKGILCHVNLIPLNRVKEKDYLSSSEINVNEFYQVLASNGIQVTIRRELGSDIDAACGQLRRNYIDNLRNTNIQGLK